MKKIFLLLSIIGTTSAFAESEIACWNIYSKYGSAPILRAKIVQQVDLENLSLNLEGDFFSSYFQDEVGNAGEEWGNKPTYTKSFIQNPLEVLEAKLITTNRSPYKGNNEYVFILGKYSFKSPYADIGYDYHARLILPTDLSAENLKNIRIRTNEKVNALMIYTPSKQQHQSGDNYLRGRGLLAFSNQ